MVVKKLQIHKHQHLFHEESNTKVGYNSSPNQYRALKVKKFHILVISPWSKLCYYGVTT